MAFPIDDMIKQGPEDCKCVALTFDLCPVKEGDGYNAELFDYLIENKIPATFFASGRWIETHPKEMKKLLKIPFFEFGVHGHYHSHLTEKTEERQLFEIMRPLEILRSKYHYTTKLFRPAFGEYNDVTLKLTNKLGLKFVLWTFESGDPDPNLSVDRIIRGLDRNTKGGSIIPFHGNRNGVHTHEIIPKYVQGKIKTGKLKLVKLSEMLK
jgi:peptidoglycan-N-acetylglucosamine deacetylase